MKAVVYTSAVYGALALVWVTCPGVLLADKPSEPAAVKRDNNSPGYDLQIIDGQLVRPTGNVEATLGRVTLGKVVDALRDQYPEANIVMSPGLANVKVGDLKLRAGRLTEELEAVRVASGEKFDLQAPGEPVPRIDPNTGLPIGSTNRPYAGLFVLRESQNPALSQRMVEAFNIGPYLEWLGRRHPGEPKEIPEHVGLEELQQMISQTVADLEGDAHPENPVKWRYHPGATLFVIIGSPDSVEIARKIVNALPGMYPAQANANRTAPEHAADDAFRARYGLPRRDPFPGQPGAPTPDPAKP